MNIIIPMAGLGSRFLQEGFTLPKPLIEVNKKPLIQHSIETLKLNGKYIFIIRKCENPIYFEKLQNKLKELQPNCVIIVLDSITKGSVETCLYASDYINNDEELIITNCDQRLEWDSELFNEFIKDNSIDGCVVTHESNNPKHSYAKIDDNNVISLIKEKEVISNNALIGLHYWKKGKDFVSSARQLLTEFDKKNRLECYISETLNYLIEQNKLIKSYNIPCNEYICLGTPYDVSIYNSKIKEFAIEKPKTIFCDIDGTILEHVHKYSDLTKKQPTILNGVIEKFNEWDSYGHKIILVTARKESARKITEKQLTDLGLCWDQLIMGITSGVRVLINDKLTSSNEDRAVSVNIFTNEGFVKQNWSKYKL